MRSQVRVVGSSYTTFVWNGGSNGAGQVLAWLDSVVDSGQAAVSTGALSQSSGPGYDTVTPLGYETAQDVVTSRVLAPGTLTATIRELWEAPAWTQLAGLTGTNNIIDIFNRMSALLTPITCQMIIKPPGTTQWRGWVYNRCTIIGIEDGENITIGGLTMARAVKILYTSRTSLVTTGPAST